MSLSVPVSWGELLDKITILEIKLDRIEDENKKINVRTELISLRAVVESQGPLKDGATALIDELRSVNGKLWIVEDDIRDCERAKDFGEKFIELARAVYHTNDVRAALKKQLNLLLDSGLVEEKSYQPY